MPAYYTDGFVVREPAWHGLATVLADYPTMGNLWSGDPTSDPYILAGHDFDLEEVELYMKMEREVPGVGKVVTFPVVPGFRAMRNSKTGTVFQCPKDSYAGIPNRVGWELAEEFVGRDPNVRVATAGVLKDGAICWLLLVLDEPFTVPGDDSTTYPFVNLHWYHDGSGALRGYRTAIRTVCSNTLDMGWAAAEQQNMTFSIRHTKGALAKVDEVKRALSGTRTAVQEYLDLATHLSSVPVTKEQRELFVQTIIPAPVGDVVSDKVRENIARDRNKVRSLFEGPTYPGDTAYGLVQVGVEYLDWLRGYRNQDTLFGRQLLRTEPLKQKLVPMVRELVSA